MRALLLSTLCPIVLLAACGPSDTTDTASTEAAAPAAAPTTPAPASPPASPPPSPPPPAAAPAQAAAAAPSPAEQAANALALRQSPMKLLSFSMGPLRGMMQGNAEFNAEVVQTNATRMALLGSMIPGVFEANPDTTGLDTTALPAIWTNKADFDAKAQALVDAATAAAAAAATGDQAATMAAVGPMTQTCGGCHDDYRSQ